MVTPSYFQTLGENVQCLLCPHECLLKPGERGLCGARENREGSLISLVWGKLSAINVDPIEKKPLYHFYPGSRILSLGSYGCNLSCLHCQNHTISQERIAQKASLVKEITPGEAVDLLKEEHLGIAYTYNEPIVWIEFVKECAALVRKRGKKNVFVSNGFINKKALMDLIPLIDAFSIDLKGFTQNFYHSLCHGSLNGVLETLERINQSDSHLEIEYLVIPGLNDDLQEFDKMLEWYENHLGKNVPLHINRYFPHYKMNRPATPVETIKKLHDRAKETLTFVHAGNMELSGETRI